MEDGTLMQAVILAGGLGTRIRSALPEGTPKAMAPINGRPFLELLFTELAQKGVTEFLVLTGYADDKIRSHFGNEFHGYPVAYSKEDSPLGTGGAISNALPRLHEKFILLNGDTFIDANLGALLDTISRSNLGMTLAHVSDVGRFGSVRIEDKAVVELLEKRGSGDGFINAGVYAVRRKLIEAVTRREWSFERDLLTTQLRELKPAYILAEGSFFDIGVPEDYRAAETFFADLMPPPFPATKK